MRISEAVIHPPLADDILLYLHNSLQHTQLRSISAECFIKALISQFKKDSEI